MDQVVEEREAEADLVMLVVDVMLLVVLYNQDQSVATIASAMWERGSNSSLTYSYKKIQTCYYYSHRTLLKKLNE